MIFIVSFCFLGIFVCGEGVKFWGYGVVFWGGFIFGVLFLGVLGLKDFIVGDLEVSL